MLPKEMTKLYIAVNESKESKIDVGQLRSELAGVAAFHSAIVKSGVLTEHENKLFSQHVGKYIDWGKVERGVGITAPAEGPPKVHLQITAPDTGVPPVRTASKAKSVECPNCHTVFMLKP